MSIVEIGKSTGLMCETICHALYNGFGICIVHIMKDKSTIAIRVVVWAAGISECDTSKASPSRIAQPECGSNRSFSIFFVVGVWRISLGGFIARY